MALYIILATQVIALFVQYRMNIKNIGVGYWLVGSALMVTGFIFMSFVRIEELLFFAMISNSLIILGHVFLYVGVQQFLENKIEKYKPFIFFLIFNLVYYYFMFINNNTSARTIAISVALSFISFMISYLIFFKKNKNVSASTIFTGSIFSLYGVFYIFRTIYVFLAEPAATYIDETEVLIASFIFEIIMTNLWTFGFIIMLNQRMNTDIKKEKEKLETIFNTNIDAQIISRFEDGLIININDGFSSLIGYEKSEITGRYIKDINFWNNPEDRDLFLEELRNNEICKNKEFTFQRKDNSQFIGTISSRIILIESVEHIISVIQDITDKKETERQLQILLEQLETEKTLAHQDSITDSLTGLANRRYFDETFSREFARIQRSGSKLSLIMIDIDYFKKYNDTYGHIVGDECLKTIADRLKTIAKRGSDIVARYGGEEFIMILPETDEEGAKLLAEELRKEIENLAIPHSSSDIAEVVTISLGVVTVQPKRLFSQEQVLNQVDKALYLAKSKGRNRWEVYS